MAVELTTREEFASPHAEPAGSAQRAVVQDHRGHRPRFRRGGQVEGARAHHHRRRHEGVLRRRRHQGAAQPRPDRAEAWRRAGSGRFLQARHSADRIHRRHQWLRLRRRPRVGAGLDLPACHSQRQGRSARDQARPHPRLRRYAAPAACGRRGAGVGDDHDRPHRRRRGSLPHRPRQPHRRGRSGRRRHGLRPRVHGLLASPFLASARAAP